MPSSSVCSQDMRPETRGLQHERSTGVSRVQPLLSLYSPMFWPVGRGTGQGWTRLDHRVHVALLLASYWLEHGHVTTPCSREAGKCGLFWAVVVHTKHQVL